MFRLTLEQITNAVAVLDFHRRDRNNFVTFLSKEVVGVEMSARSLAMRTYLTVEKVFPNNPARSVIIKKLHRFFNGLMLAEADQVKLLRFHEKFLKEEE